MFYRFWFQWLMAVCRTLFKGKKKDFSLIFDKPESLAIFVSLFQSTHYPQAKVPSQTHCFRKIFPKEAIPLICLSINFYFKILNSGLTSQKGVIKPL